MANGIVSDRKGCTECTEWTATSSESGGAPPIQRKLATIRMQTGIVAKTLPIVAAIWERVIAATSSTWRPRSFWPPSDEASAAPVIAGCLDARVKCANCIAMKLAL